MTLETGDKIPEFSLPTNGGGTLNSADLLGKWAVIYFYPKDNTPGCTTEAVAFTARKKEFEDLNCSIVGISKDSVKKHDNFVAKHDLGILLASDEGNNVCEQFGVWKEKSMYGKKLMGIERSTFLINPKGKLTDSWRKVRVAGHVDTVLSTLSAHNEA